MRILYVLNSFGIGGAERQALTLAARMQQRGHRVALLALESPQARQWPTELPVVYMELRRGPAGMIGGAARAIQLVRQFHPELLHSHGFHANIVARLLKAAFPRAVVVTTIHNVYEGGTLRRWSYRLTDPLSERIVAVSQAVRAQFLRQGSGSAHRCCVIPNAVEDGEFVPDDERRSIVRGRMGTGSEFVWLAAGRLAPGKDYPNLLRAFAEVRVARTDARLWIAGRDLQGALSSLENLAAALKLEGVSWLGQRDDLPALLDAADGFVLASAWEGMPVALAEAMAMATPAVVTDVGGNRELLGGCGPLVAPGNPGALAKAMLDVMALDEPARACLGSAARERILEGFTMRARAVEWERLYEGMLLRPNEHASRQAGSN